MPIRAEEKGRYPADWPAISRAVKDAAGWRCECTGECGSPRHDDGTAPLNAEDGRCERAHGDFIPGTDKPVILTTAHLDHTPEHNSVGNLRAYCQLCHFAYDRDHHAATRERNRRARARD